MRYTNAINFTVPNHNPSSTTSEQAAIYGSLQKIKEDTEFNIYTDSLATINSINKYLKYKNSNPRQTLKLKNHSLIIGISEQFDRIHHTPKITHIKSHQQTKTLNNIADYWAKNKTRKDSMKPFRPK